MKLFGRKRDDDAEETYRALRQLALDLTPALLGSDIPAGAPALALLMETGYPTAVATLVGVVDGTTSMYFSNGGGMIGAGSHPEVAAVTHRWLEMRGDTIDLLHPVSAPEPPGDGVTQFVAVTPRGLLGAALPEADLVEQRHPLSQLFYAGQDVITQLRLSEAA